MIKMGEIIIYFGLTHNCLVLHIEEKSSLEELVSDYEMDASTFLADYIAVIC